MGGLKDTGKELETEKRKVVIDGKDWGLCVKMLNGIHLLTAGGYSEGSVLDPFEFLDGGGGGAGEPDGLGVGEEGGNEGFVCEDRGLLALSKGVASRGRQDVDTRGGAGDMVNMGSQVTPRV